MGYGDDIMATGLARGAKARGRRVAFGDGKRIFWGPHSREIFRGNPNIAAPGDEGAGDLEWLAFYKGHRLYNRQGYQRWIWNYGFKIQPGEFYGLPPAFTMPDRIVIEPNVPNKAGAINKFWPAARYQAVADELGRLGFLVCQPDYGAAHTLRNVELVQTATFRDVAALLKTAELYIGPEGGLHHAAAAIGLPAVVLFGGFIPPQVTGYAFHTNLTGGEPLACGSLLPCTHCASAMRAITIEDVCNAAVKHLREVRARGVAGPARA